MSSQARRQRRAIAKQMGYLGRNETLPELFERTRRSSDFGKQLHTLHLERLMNDQLETERNKKILSDQSLIELVKIGSDREEPQLHLDSEAFTFLNDIKDSGPEASPSESMQEKNNV
jgi:hypothetical protein